MFRILQQVRFYSHSFVRKKMGEVRGIIEAAAEDRTGRRVLTPEELVVTYHDGPGKSGAQMARLFCDERGLPSNVIVERAELQSRISDSKIQVVLVLDDFVGTGESARLGLQGLNERIGDIVRTRDVRIVFATVVAFDRGWESLRKSAEDLQLGIRVYCCELLGEKDRVFSSLSNVFSDDIERTEARNIALKFGTTLQKRCALGYGDLELAVVFERGCPNNSLPILWAEGRAPKWTPLFKRL
jgi:hypothetical protein